MTLHETCTARRKKKYVSPYTYKSRGRARCAPYSTPLQEFLAVYLQNLNVRSSVYIGIPPEGLWDDDIINSLISIQPVRFMKFNEISKFNNFLSFYPILMKLSIFCLLKFSLLISINMKMVWTFPLNDNNRHKEFENSITSRRNLSTLVHAKAEKENKTTSYKVIGWLWIRRRLIACKKHFQQWR